MSETPKALAKGAYRLPCGCIHASNPERVISMCACCHDEFTQRHQSAEISGSHVYRAAQVSA